MSFRVTVSSRCFGEIGEPIGKFSYYFADETLPHLEAAGFITDHL